MMYNEIVERLKVHAPVDAREVSAAQMFKLYEDRHLKYVECHGDHYELNLVPLDGEHHIYELIKEEDSFKAFTELLEVFIENTKKNKRSFLIYDHKEYEVVLELMESCE